MKTPLVKPSARETAKDRAALVSALTLHDGGEDSPVPPGRVLAVIGVDPGRAMALLMVLARDLIQLAPMSPEEFAAALIAQAESM